MVIGYRGPFRSALSLEDAVDHLFERSFGRTRCVLQAGPGPTLPVEARETDTAVIIKVYLPGVQPEDLELVINADELTIRGEFHFTTGGSTRDGSPNKWERAGFERSLRLPVSVVAEGVEAEFKKGILIVWLPKEEEGLVDDELADEGVLLRPEATD